MKYVEKTMSPSAFEAWKAKSNDDWQPSFENLQNPEKSVLHDALLNEQGGVCCYCGREVTLESSHVEHFRPQKRYDDLALDYTNLFASCIRHPKQVPLHCGHAKQDKFDESLHLAPTDPACESRFLYSFDGRILPRHENDERACFMRDLLALDVASLNAVRAEVLKSTFDPDFLDMATAEDLQRLKSVYGAPDSNGKRLSLGHVVAAYAQQWLDGTPARS